MTLSIKQMNDINVWMEYVDNKPKSKDDFDRYNKKKIKNQDRVRRKNRQKRTYNNWS